MAKEYAVVHRFLDPCTAEGLVYREVDTTYPPPDVKVPSDWMEYLIGYRTAEGKPVLAAKASNRKEATDILDAE